MTVKLCLNMIVKNESKVIKRMLQSVLPIIDVYCICDTGSTDNTIEVIKDFFDENKINGKIISEPFRDFGYNRTFALNACNDIDADYILLMDADMTLKLNANFDKLKFHQQLKEYDAHHIFQGSHNFYYKNTRIVKNNLGFKYWGVTHEYVAFPENTGCGCFDTSDIFIIDIGDGGSKTNKFMRDVELLTKGLEENPGNDRYTFYLANSYRDLGEKDKAIKLYEKRAKLGGWVEEVWFSYYSIGNCYMEKGEPEKAIFNWLKAFNVFPNRIENLYKIINYYRITGNNLIAYNFYKIACEQLHKNQKLDFLFLEKDVYNYKLDYELSIIGYYNNVSNDIMMKCFMKLFVYPFLDENIHRNMLNNYKFYVPILTDNKNDDFSENIEILSKKCDEFVKNADFTSSTPSLVLNDGKLVLNVRHVNYEIDKNGGYICKKNIETTNVISSYDISQEKWKKENEFILQHDPSLDNFYIGLEDMKLFSHKNQVYFNANRGLSYQNMAVEHGFIDFKTKTTNSFLLKGCENTHLEKNWALFEDNDQNMRCIYGWYPLKIGTIAEKQNAIEIITDPLEYYKNMDCTFFIDKIINTPLFFKYVRCSTNGVVIGDEIWFICHTVSYENRRHYYHIFIAIDKKTLEIKRFSPYFKFLKEEQVEYSLGFVKIEDNLLIGYSTMDNQTNYMSIKIQKIEEMFLQLGFQ